jgi:hypothetical protein
MALENPKHERFAQELAKGRTQEEAYRAAGYTGDRTAASRLSTNVNVQARLAEILERSAVRAEITVASVTENLSRIAKKAEDLSESSGLSVARAAWMDAAKLNGLVIDKSMKAEATLEELLDRIDGASGSASTPTH